MNPCVAVSIASFSLGFSDGAVVIERTQLPTISTHIQYHSTHKCLHLYSHWSNLYIFSLQVYILGSQCCVYIVSWVKIVVKCRVSVAACWSPTKRTVYRGAQCSVMMCVKWSAKPKGKPTSCCRQMLCPLWKRWVNV